MSAESFWVEPLSPWFSSLQFHNTDHLESILPPPAFQKYSGITPLGVALSEALSSSCVNSLMSSSASPALGFLTVWHGRLILRGETSIEVHINRKERKRLKAKGLVSVQWWAWSTYACGSPPATSPLGWRLGEVGQVSHFGQRGLSQRVRDTGSNTLDASSGMLNHIWTGRERTKGCKNNSLGSKSLVCQGFSWGRDHTDETTSVDFRLTQLHLFCKTVISWLGNNGTSVIYEHVQ